MQRLPVSMHTQGARVTRSLLAATSRNFGAPAGDPNHVYVIDQSKSKNTSFKIPSDADESFQLPKKMMLNERAQMWLSARWQPERDNVLDNTKVNQYSAYYWFSSQSALQNTMVLKVAKALFDRRTDCSDHHEGLDGVTASENGLFLYKSDQAAAYLASRIYDYMLVTFTGAWLLGAHPLMILPVGALAFTAPRKLAYMQYFTFHAELHPHTEQVVFHKANFFGQVTRHHVDIKNLEKIEATTLPSSLLWQINMFDSEMVFRDNETQEVFVFDKYGHWNKDTLEHPLLY